MTDVIKPGPKRDIYSSCKPIGLVGHVNLVEAYDYPQFKVAYAILKLKDPPGKKVIVFTSEHRLQTVLETALATGYHVTCWGQKIDNAPPPREGTWSLDVYGIEGVILYDSP